jgi:hypothetical protein
MYTVSLDATDLTRVGNLMAAAGKNAPGAIRRAINHTGDKARTQVIRALTGQTGLKRKTIVRAVKVTRASAGGMAYVLTTRGGNVALKFFGARETRAGVSAAPWNARQVFAGAFIRGGRFPARVPLKLGGQVFKRAGSGRLPIAWQKSGLFIPKEMVEGQTRSAFMGVVVRDLPARAAHELLRTIGG